MNLLLLIIAIIPVMLLGYYVYYKDKNREPQSLLFKFFLLGILSVLIVYTISSFLSLFIPLMNKDIANMNYRELSIYVFLLVAFIEEGIKLLMTYLLGYNNREFDEKYDIIVYSVFVALGFAFYENLVYIFLNKEISIGIYRAFFAVPAHASFAIFMGYFLGKAKYSNSKSYRLICIISSILVPMLLHGIYDFCCLANSNLFVIFFFLFVLNIFIFSYMKLREVASDDEILT